MHFMISFLELAFLDTVNSDTGTQFILAATQTVWKLLGISHVFATLCNTPANEVCENCNATLKKDVI